MKLCRLSGPATVASSAVGKDLGCFITNDSADIILISSFQRFGNGPERQSDFQVQIYWTDIEEFINKFADGGQQKAKEIKAGQKLLRYLRKFVKETAILK